MILEIISCHVMGYLTGYLVLGDLLGKHVGADGAVAAVIIGVRKSSSSGIAARECAKVLWRQFTLQLGWSQSSDWLGSST